MNATFMATSPESCTVLVCVVVVGWGVGVVNRGKANPHCCFHVYMKITVSHDCYTKF